MIAMRLGFALGVMNTAGIVGAFLEPAPVCIIGWIGEAFLLAATTVLLVRGVQ